MRIAFFGTAEFAVPSLRILSESIVLAVSQPDRPSGRGLKLSPSPVKRAAAELGIRVETPEKCRAPEFVEFVRGLELDMLLVAAYGQILPQSLLDSARQGAVNLHGSLLPKYRGAAPIQRCILNGETETGVTLMQMDRGMDTGDIITSLATPIAPDETYGELEARLGELAAQMALVWTPKIAAGDYPRYPQDDNLATYAPKVSREEAELKVERPALVEFNRFRAFTPSPGAWILTRFGRLRILEAGTSSGTGEPGTIVMTRPELTVAFADASLQLLSVKPEGRGAMAGSDWANGHRLKPGDLLLAQNLELK